MLPRKPVGIVLSESFGPISKSQKRVFYGSQNLVSRVIWGFSVSVPNFKTGVSQSRTLLQIKRKKNRGGYFLTRGRWGCAAGRGRIDYNGVAFSMALLEWGRTFSDFWSKKVLHICG